MALRFFHFFVFDFTVNSHDISKEYDEFIIVHRIENILHYYNLKL